MKLVTDRATQAAALNTIRELIAAGLAGLDCYDRDIFVVDAPTAEIRDNADVALDHLGAQMIRDGAYGAPRSMLQCRLNTWVRRELDLDRLGAPEIVVPLASRGLMSGTERAELQSGLEFKTSAYVNRAIDQVMGVRN